MFYFLNQQNKVAREKFINLVNDHINDGTTCFDDLCDSDKHEIVGRLIDCLDDRTEWLVNCDDLDDIVINLIDAMTCSGRDEYHEKQFNFLEATEIQALKYFRNSLNEYFNYAAQEYKNLNRE
jgi:hypothetical protein